MDEIFYATATELAQRLKSRQLSAVEVMEAFIDRIEAVNPAINALVALRAPDELLEDAKRADAMGASGALHGLPVAVKDLSDVIGIPTRHGSPVTPDVPATRDTLFVSRMREAGAIFVGKTNTPEFGAGSQTFNPVFGTTTNPFDTSRTPGGSSGGAAAAVATGMLAVADGSDLGGSLRNPAAFCGVVGLRPTMGRVPQIPDASAYINRVGVSGPMARNVQDLGLLLSVMAGPDARDPISWRDPEMSFAARRAGELDGLRVAWGGDLGLPYEPEALAVPEAAASRFEAAGAHVESAAPNLDGAMDAFRTFRALLFRGLADAIPRDRWHLMKDSLTGNIEAGLALNVADVIAAEAIRTRIHLEMTEFFTHYDVLAVPTTQVAPFPIDVEYPMEIDTANGTVAMTDYIDWMSSCCVMTVTGCPAISLPAGFTKAGLPLGLQLVAPVGQESRLLDIAQGYESATGDLRRRPIVMRSD